ncbi:hypothetical protein [Prevotella jejuni]
MNAKELSFNEELTTSFFSEELNTDILLYLLDDLNASTETLSLTYKEQIANFCNALPDWYPFMVDQVKKWVLKNYDYNIEDCEIELLSIMILFEQDEESVFGLEFHIDNDSEHGCGVKVLDAGNKYEVLNIDTADVAFY